MLQHATNALRKLAGSRHVGPLNPSFPLTVADARPLLAEMASDRKPLARPVVVLGGFLDLGIGPYGFAAQLRRCAAGDVLPMAFADCLSFEACCRRVVGRIDRRFGRGPDAERTIAVDVVGQSMGGLIALVAALGSNGRRRLSINRLFTVASPLRGAAMAALTPFNCWPLQSHMRPGSALYARLAEHPPACEVISYTRLGDLTVGERHASLAGGKLWWLDNPRPEAAHIGALGDARILLDIARRLRGEPPVATEPPAPLPA
jgi:pimeloyl-ACP methyl ester carboxylesterase